MDLKGKRVLVVGLARTGVAAALFCAARGAVVTATESRTKAEIGESVALLRAAGVSLELGGHQEKTFLQQELIVPSPGVPAGTRRCCKQRAPQVSRSGAKSSWRIDSCKEK